MKRTFIIAASSLGLLFVGAGLPVANASSTPALLNAGTALLASTATAQSKQERREIRQMQKAADRRERANQQNHSGSSNTQARSGNSDRNRGSDRADRNRGGNDRHASRGNSRSYRNDSHDRGRSYRDHDSHSRYRSSSSYRNNSRYSDRHHDDHRSGVHIGIGSSGVHFGVHSGSHGHHTYSHRSYGHSSRGHSSYSRPYRYYQPRTYYRPYYTYSTPVIQREVVVIEREPVVRERVIVRRPTASSVDGLRGWDYLIHGESARALSYFSDVCQTYYDAGLPKLGFGFSALAKGDLRNGAHGIRRAFEFDADGVSDGPAVAEFDQLVAELRAGVEHRIETDGHVTSDHWFLSAAMAFYDRDYHNAKYAIDAAKNLGDSSRGCVALAQMIDGKIAYEASMR